MKPMIIRSATGKEYIAIEFIPSDHFVGHAFFCIDSDNTFTRWECTAVTFVRFYDESVEE